MTVFEEMDNYYARLCACSSSTGRKYNGLAMIELAEKHPELLEYWQIDTSYRLWENRFKKYREYDTPVSDYDDEHRDYTINNRGTGDYEKLINNIKNNEKFYTNIDKTMYNDGINFNVPKESGLYMFGEITFDPQRNKFLYGIKVGLGKDLASRVRVYKTCGSTPFLCDYLLVPEDKLEYAESMFHLALNCVCQARNSHNKEWFYVDKETYLEITSKGFAYFD